MGDVLTGDTTGVEGTHGELGARLADGLGGDHAHGFSELDVLVGGERAPVTGAADALLGLTREHGADHDLVDGGVIAQLLHEILADLGTDRYLGAVGKGDVAGQHPAVDPGLQVIAGLFIVGADIAHPDPTGTTAVHLADYQLLGHIDEPARQVAGVGGTQGGVGQALASTVGGNEVLEHRQPLPEGGDDRPGDHLAPGVGHQALHAGDLTDLLRVTAGARVHHHVQGVEGDLVKALLHGLADLGVGRRPDLDLLLAPFVVGDDAPFELVLGLLGGLLVALDA